MDIKQLQYFIAIAEEKNLTAAANRLHMTQPPLSIQLKQLEQELGVKLFERSNKGMELTDKGNILYKRAVNLVNNMEDIKNEIQETEKGKKGVLDRKSTRLNSSHVAISYAVFCLKKKKTKSKTT